LSFLAFLDLSSLIARMISRRLLLAPTNDYPQALAWARDLIVRGTAARMRHTSECGFASERIAGNSTSPGSEPFIVPKACLYNSRPQRLQTAAQTARLFNVAAIAAPFQLSRPTIRDYLALFERVFLIELLPPWHSNRISRLVKSPKLQVGDSGLAAALLGADSDSVVEDRALFGQLLETFIFQELNRQASWRDDAPDLFHFRDRDGAEVDIVIERGARHVAGVEVKAAATVTESDFRGLRKLAQATGGRFVRGVVLYDGQTVLRFGDRLQAVPIRLLWEAE